MRSVRGFALAMLFALSCCSAAAGAARVPAHVPLGRALASAEREEPVDLAGTALPNLSFQSPFPELPASITPAQASADAASRTKFSGLGTEPAVSLAEKDFGVQRPAWTTPGVSDGGRLGKYVGERSVRETLPGGKRVVVSSALPLRVNNGSGLAPLSLSLRASGDVYVPQNPLVPVAISQHAEGGVAFASGLTVAPTSDGSGEAAVVAGDRLVFHEAAEDTDYMVGPAPEGAEVSWMLRSQESPQEESLVFKLPVGVSLRDSSAVPGGAEVLEEGKPILAIAPAAARDAAGEPIPTTYSINGDTLTTHVDLNGHVDFPVLVDPVFNGYYGSVVGAHVWSGWMRCSNAGCGQELGCLTVCFAESENLIQAGSYPGPANGEYAEWKIVAPGAGTEGGAGITRVDLSEATHREISQSYIYAGIEGTENKQIYTYDSLKESEDKKGPLDGLGALTNQPISFCAATGGGEDGGQYPLCNEEDQGTVFWIADVLGPEPRTAYNYIQTTGASVTFRDATPPNEVHMYLGVNEGEWQPHGPEATISAHDQGLGIYKFELKIPPGSSETNWSETLSCKQSAGFVGCPQSEGTSTIHTLTNIATGVWTLGVYAEDAAGNWKQQVPAPKIYVDHTPPVLGALTGSLHEGAGKTIGNGNYVLNFSASDGSLSAPQSGMDSLIVKVDGELADQLTTSCPPPKGAPPTENCYSLSGSWTFNGEKYGIGTHTITVEASDYLGNVSKESFTVTVNEAGTEQAGPGRINLQTGNFVLNATDVSVGAGAATLSVNRTYESRQSAWGHSGPLGPEWTLSVPGSAAATEWQSLTVAPQGSVELTPAHGGTVTFAPKETGYTSPAGFQNDTLTKVSSSEYKLSDAQGDYTLFTQPASGSALYPSSVAEASSAGGLNPIKYTFAEGSQGFIEPTEVLGPEPSLEACKTTLVKGCRALKFKYATSKTATGEGRSEWGSYEGRLEEITYTAWEPAKGEIKTVLVAKYEYDSLGRLRAEWNPEIKPGLRTDYGYNSERLLTSATPPGQESWVFTYGTITGDENTGRLLKWTRAQAAAPLWDGSPPTKVEYPVISGSATVGTTLGMSRGSWGNEPVAFSYQWSDCNSSHGECSLIVGANNPNYTLRESDQGHAVQGIVIATNGGGSAKDTVWTGVVSTGTVTEGTHYSPEPGATIEYNVPASGSGAPYALGAKEVEAWGQKEDPEQGTAIFPPDEPQSWPATSYKRASIFYRNNANQTVNVATPTGGISTAEYSSTSNDVTRILTPDNREAALKAGSESATVAQHLSTERIYSTAGTELLEVLGPEHTVKRDGGGEVKARSFTSYEYDRGEPSGGPYHLVTSTIEGLKVGSGGVEDARTVTKSYTGQNLLGWELHEPTSASTTAGGVTLSTSTAYEPTTGQVEETETAAGRGRDVSVPPSYETAFGTKGEGAAEFMVPEFDAIDASGYVWVSDLKNNRLEQFTSSGTLKDVIGWGVSNGEPKLETCTSNCKAGIAGEGNGQMSEPEGIAISGGDVYVADYNNGRIDVFKENGEYAATIATKGTGLGQLESPVGIAVSEGNDLWVSEIGSSRLQDFTTSGTPLKVVGWSVSNSESKFEICTSSCKAGKSGSGAGQFARPQGIAFTGGKMYVAEATNRRIQELTETGEYVANYGTAGKGLGQFEELEGIVRNPKNGELLVTDYGNDRVDDVSPNLSEGKIVYQFADKGSGENQLKGPTGIAINLGGDAFVVDSGNSRIEEFQPAVNGIGAAHKTQTFYYTAGVNTHAKSCGEHPEWAGLPCQAQHTEEPNTTLPPLTITTYTYNIWQEPVTITDAVGTTKRVTTITYDPAGRKTGTAITSTAGTTLPEDTYKYSESTGTLDEQSNSNGEHIGMTDNALGQMTSYTDAEGITSSYEYEKEKDDRLIKTNNGKGTQTFVYSTTTGALEKLEDSGVHTFTATYDVEGNITTEGYPNGMTATYTRNAVGEATSLVYEKNKRTIYSDSIIPSIHDQWLSQTSSLASDTYTYNEVGWLTETQETPTGKDCTARLYVYDEDGNRASQTTRQSETSTCSTEGGSIQTFSYDTADQLEGSGINYEPFGNITELPSEDSGGSILRSTFYDDDQLATIEQAGQTIVYTLDPANRNEKATTVAATMAFNYAGPGNDVSWSLQGTSWTRLVPGLSGGLAAIETNGKTPVLQVANLHGDIVGQVEDNPNEAEPKLLSPTEATEYGAPTTSKPEPYAWLGSGKLRAELPTGIIDMGARTYIPQLGRFEQADPQPGGSLNSYTYTDDDPITEADPSGEVGGTIRINEGAVAQGEGTNLPGGVGIAPGAIMPPPVNPQVIEEFNAHPPWNAAAAYSEEAEGEEEGGSPVAHAASLGVGWVCALGGAVVAAGIFVGSDGTAAVQSILAGGIVTAGCQAVVEKNTANAYFSGLPVASNVGSGCFNEWTISKRTHKRNHRSLRCQSWYA